MAIFRTGDMWSALPHTDFFIVTTNSFIRKDGALVMGRGIAQQLRDRVPGFDAQAGRWVQETVGHLGQYYLAIGPTYGLFQVKRHFSDKADFDLIQGSAERLRIVAESLPGHSFALNFPGIGNGGLPYDQVKPLLNDLPDNVSIWAFN